MSPGMLNVSSAGLMSVGSFHLLVSSLVACVVPLMSGNTAQFRLSCQSVYLDLMWTDTQWVAAALEWLMPCMEERVWVLDNLRRCTIYSVIKWHLEALSKRTLHGTYCPDFFLSSTTVVARNVWFCGLPLKIKYVLISVGGIALFMYSWLTVSW